MSLVAFMIPFVFIFQPVLLWEGEFINILLTALFSAVGVVVWAAAISGYIGANLSLPLRFFLAALALGILLPTGIWITISAIVISAITIYVSTYVLRTASP